MNSTKSHQHWLSKPPETAALKDYPYALNGNVTYPNSRYCAASDNRSVVNDATDSSHAAEANMKRSPHRMTRN